MNGSTTFPVLLSASAGGWEVARCALCGEHGGDGVLEVRHPDAPHGVSHIVRCRRCGLRRLDPRPGPDVLARYYDTDSMAYGGRQRSSAKQAVWDWLRDASSGQPARFASLPGVSWGARRMARYAFDINIDLRGCRGTPLRVIDVGCGYGDLLFWLKSRGCEVQGVDFDERAASRAREYGVPVHVGRLHDLRLADGSVDVAVMCHSLEHVSDPREVLTEINRVLRPGGHLHVAVPNGESAGLRREGAMWGHLSHPIHFWYFSRDDLHRLLAECGFDAVLTSYVTTWADHRRFWRTMMASAPTASALSGMVALLGETLTRRRAGDVLRVVCRRRPSGSRPWAPRTKVLLPASLPGSCSPP